MSIVCMKRNSRHNPRVDPISGKGKDGFSLNGGHRNIGGVGRFRMVSNTTRTPFRGNLPMGSGGSNGTYDTTICNSGACCTNDPDIIKPSSVNTSGMIQMRYERKWDSTNETYICPRLILNSQYPYSWTQQGNSSYVSTNDQGLYIRKKTMEYGQYVFINAQGGSEAVGSEMNCLDKGNTIGNTIGNTTSNAIGNAIGNECIGNKSACSYYIGSKKYIRMPYAKNLNQPAMSQEQYINTGGPARRNCLPSPASKQPFPMNLVQGTKGCNSIYNTWQEAQTAGLLPSNYIG